MKVDFKRSFYAPFSTQADEGLLNIYIVAVGFSIVIFFIHLLFTVLGFAGTVFICLIHVVHSVIVLSTQSFEFGYIAETIKLEVNNENKVMPGWQGNYARFFIRGLQVQFIVLIYYLLSFIPAVVVTFILSLILPYPISSLLSAHAGGEEYTLPLIVIILSVLLSLFLLISVLIVSFILPMACIRFAARNKFISAFNIWAIIKSIFFNLFDYSLVTILILLLCIPILVIFLLLCLTIIGWVGVGLFQFVLLIIFCNMYAQVYKDKRLI